MHVEIKVTPEECKVVLNAVTALNSREHVYYMSLQMLADASGIKVTKVRHVVEYLVCNQYLQRYIVSDKQVKPRYYYVLTGLGNEYLQQA